MDNSGSAFPILDRSEHDSRDGSITHQTKIGMTLRDYFAAKAMLGLISGAMADGTQFDDQAVPIVSMLSYSIADAMLKARQA